MCDQKPSYPVSFSCRLKSYPLWCKQGICHWAILLLLLLFLLSFFKYSSTSPQRPPSGQKKVAFQERWPLLGVIRGVMRQFCQEYNSTWFFSVLSSYLLCPIIIMMVIQSYKMQICRDKIHRKLELCRDQTSKVCNIRYKYDRRLFLLIAAV